MPRWIRATRPQACPPLAELLIAAVGRMGRGAEAELFTRYADRIRPRLTLREVPDGRGAPLEIRRREGQALLAALPTPRLLVALDPPAATPDSAALAAQLTRWLETGRPVCFVIGGAEGLSDDIIAASDHTLSFGPMIWPHLLARVMLAEQLFRACAIATGHPYHRGRTR